MKQADMVLLISPKVGLDNNILNALIRRAPRLLQKREVEIFQVDVNAYINN